MSVKSGSIIFDGNGFIIDRIQTGGVTNLNIPQERVYEDGNPKTVGIVRDIPDLTFECESWDVSTDLEALVLGLDPSTVATGTQALDFYKSVPFHITSPFRAANTSTSIVNGIAVPYLNLETVVYRFGVRQNATKTFTFRGDSIYYIPGTPQYDTFVAAGTGPYNLPHAAIQYDEEGDTMYVLGLCWIDPTTGIYKRLFHNFDYTDSTNAFSLTAAAAAGMPSGAVLHAVWGSTAAATVALNANASTSVKPAAVRAKDLDAYVLDPFLATPTLVRWDGVQSFEVTRRVTLQNDEEFGNKHYVAQDYDTAEVSGTIGVKAVDAINLFRKIAQVSNVPIDQVIGVYSSQPIPIELHINHPDTGARIETLYCSDARFTPPPIQGRVNQKLETSFPFQSEEGNLQAFKGARVA